MSQRILSVALIALISLLSANATAATYYWDGTSVTVDGASGGGTGTWQVGTAGWEDGTIAQNWADGNAAVFAGTGGTVTISGTVAPGSISVNTANNYAFSGGVIGGGATLDKGGAGTLTLSGANTYTGGTTIQAGAGALIATVDTTQNPLGTGGVSIGAGGTCQINNTNTSGTTVNIPNVFTGAGLVKLDFAAGGSARNTTMSNVTGFAGTIQLSNSGANGDKWNVGGVSAPGATVQVDSGSQFFVTGADTFAGVRILGTGNTENRGAIRLTNSLTAPITLMGNATIGGEGGTITGTVSTGVAGTSTLTLGTSSSNNLPADMLKGIISNGTGTLALNVYNQNSGNIFITGSRANTYSGGTTLLGTSNGTRLVIGGISATPYGSGPITIGQAATDKAGIYFNSANQTLANAIVFNTALGTDRPGVRSDATNITLSGTVTANLAPATFSTNGTGSFNLTGRVTGGSGLTLNNTYGSSIGVTLNNATANPNDYQGDTTIAGTKGTLTLGAANQIPNGAGKGNVVNNGTLNLNGFSETINGLSGSGTVNGGSGSPVLTVGDNNATSTFAGSINNSGGGTLALTKTGSGTFTLSGNNGYTGPTTVAGGTLAIGGSAGGDGCIQGNITINSGATLK